VQALQEKEEKIINRVGLKIGDIIFDEFNDFEHYNNC